MKGLLGPARRCLIVDVPTEQCRFTRLLMNAHYTVSGRQRDQIGSLLLRTATWYPDKGWQPGAALQRLGTVSSMHVTT